MRFIFGLGFACLCLLATGQQQETKNLFQTVRPDVFIVVHKHPTGADMVTVSVLDPQYSPQLLQNQILTMGKYLRVTPRGLQLTSDSIGPKGEKPLSILKATFATNGLINGSAGLNLQAIARAFVSPDSHVHGLDVIFDGVRGTPHLVQRFHYPLSGPIAVDVQGQAVGQPPAVEYRIELNTTDPSQVVIPATVEDAPKPVPSPAPHSSSWILWVLIGLFSTGIFLLVYNLALRKTTSNRRTDRR